MKLLNRYRKQSREVEWYQDGTPYFGAILEDVRYREQGGTFVVIGTRSERRSRLVRYIADETRLPEGSIHTIDTGMISKLSELGKPQSEDESFVIVCLNLPQDRASLHRLKKMLVNEQRALASLREITTNSLNSPEPLEFIYSDVRPDAFVMGRGSVS